MASDNEASCVSDPNFAVICSFLECFGKSCGIEYPDIAMLQEMVENAQEVPQQLIDLHVKLLRKTRKTVSAEKWERALVKFCHTYSNQDGWELERFGYKKARIAVKLRLLKVLLEAQFDLNTRFKNEVNKLAATELRVEPLGRDKSGLAYWCQLDEDCNIRVYREDLDEESWELVAKDRDGVVNLISTLSNGEIGDILVNEDSNSLEISEKPIIDTGQVTSSPSLEDENRDDFTNGVDAVGIDGKVAEDGGSAEEDLEDEEEDEDDDEEDGEEDEQGEEEEEEEGEVDEEEEEEEEEGEEDMEEGDVTNEDSSQQNTEDEDSQEAIIPPPESANKKIIELGNLSKQGTALPQFEPKKVTNPEALGIPISIDTRRKVNVGAENLNCEQKDVEIKHIQPTVIKTSPIKVINISELTKPPVEEPKLDVKVPIGITLTPVIKQVPCEDVADVKKVRDNLPTKSNIFYSSNESISTQNKISLKPIDKLAANLVKLQSEKMEKPSGIKSLAKITENLARSSGILGIVTSPEEDRQIPDFSARNQVDKSAPSRSQRGMDLSTSPRGWESLGDRNRPVDCSGMDLSSRKFVSKNTELPPPAYRAHDFQHKEMDLSTRKPTRSESSNLPYDARSISRSHSMIADLSKRQLHPQLPFTGYNSPPVYRNSVEHRLPNYSILADPNKIAASRLVSVGSKRPLEEDDVPRDITKRIHVDVPLRAAIDKRQIMSGNWRDEVGEAIEEPVMNVQGEGSGSDCDAVNPGIGEAIDEPVIYFYGEGLGCECETGNPTDETSTENEDSKESKHDKNLNLSDSKIFIKSSSTNEQTSTEPRTDKVLGSKMSENYSQPGTSSADNTQALETITETPESDKTKFKPKLGIQVFTKSSSPVKRLSRWDVRSPVEKNNTEHDDLVLSKAVEASTIPAESTHSQLSTIKESTTEEDVEAETSPTKLDSNNDASKSQTENRDIIQSETSELGEDRKETAPTIEEPCRHDSSMTIGAGLIKAIVPGLLAVPGAEKLAEKQNEDDNLAAVESSDNNTDLPCEEKTTETSNESLPRFFFGPNCVSYNLKNDEKKNSPVDSLVNVDTTPETSVSESASFDTKQTENESVVELARDLANTVNIEKTTVSSDVQVEKSTDSIARSQTPDTANNPVPETMSTEELTDPVSKERNFGKEIDSMDENDCTVTPIDSIPVNEQFEKLAVSESETTAAATESIDCKPDDEMITNKEATDSLVVSDNSEKLIVPEATTAVQAAESTSLLTDKKIVEKPNDLKVETEEFKESTQDESTNTRDEDQSSHRIAESESMEKTTYSTDEGKSIDFTPKDESLKTNIDFVPDTQNIEQSSDSLDDSQNIESIQKVDYKISDFEKSESLNEPVEFTSDNPDELESIEESDNTKIVTEKAKDPEVPLPDIQSITTEAIVSDNQESKLDEQQLLTETPDLKGEENISNTQSNLDIQTTPEEQQVEKQEVEKPEVEQSLTPMNEPELSDEFQESQTISELNISINEDELLKSSSDSEQDQNAEGEKTLEEELLWSSQSEVAEQIVDKKKDTVCEDVHEDSSNVSSLQAIENQTEIENNLESKLEIQSTTEQSSSEQPDLLFKNISDSEKITDTVSPHEDNCNKTIDSLSEPNIDDNQSENIKNEALNESKEFNKITENIAANEKPESEPEQNVTSIDSLPVDKSSKIPQTEMLNNADLTPRFDRHTKEILDKPSTVAGDEDQSSEQEQICFNQITPTAIIDSNISQPPERFNVESKNEGAASALADIADDYCDPASEDPSSSADQDSNEAMVIDDRMSDSNESSKDFTMEDSISNSNKVLEEEKKLLHPVITTSDNKNPANSNIEKISENKNEEPHFNLKEISDRSKEDTSTSLPVEKENESKFEGITDVEKPESTNQNADVTNYQASKLEVIPSPSIKDNLLEETKCEDETVEKCTVESELEEPEDAVGNSAQDNSTDDQKSLVANYDSSDRESDDVFENDLVENASNVDAFNDTASNEQFLEKNDEEENSVLKVDESYGKVEANIDLLPKEKQELSNDVTESKTELETESCRTKISEDVNEERTSRLDIEKVNTKLPDVHSELNTEAKTSSVEMNSQEDETEQVIAEDEKCNATQLLEYRPDDKLEYSINEEKLSAPIITDVQDTKESQSPVDGIFNTEGVVITKLKSGIDSEDKTKKEETEIEQPEFTDEPSVEKSIKETDSDLTKETSTEENVQETASSLVETNIKQTTETGEPEQSKSQRNYTVSNLQPIEEDTRHKSSLGQVLEEEKTILIKKLDIVNESLPVTVAAKHSLEPDRIDFNDSDQQKDELSENETPIVHHSKRFKEDLNLSMLGDDKSELKAISIFASDLKKKDSGEFTAGSDLLNHNINYAIPNKFERSEDSEKSPTPVLDISKKMILEKTYDKIQENLMSSEDSFLEAGKVSLSKYEIDKIDESKDDTDIAGGLPVISENLVIKRAVDTSKESEKEESIRLPEVLAPEDISTMKSKELNVESLTKSSASVKETISDSQEYIIAPQNSFGEISVNPTDDGKSTEPNIPNTENLEKMQLSDNTSLMKPSTDETKGSNDPEIQGIDPKDTTIESDDSMDGADNDDPFSNSQNEMDPLDCIDGDGAAKTTIDDNASAAALGIRVKPVSELVYEGWKLDGTETPKISRKRRNSNHESNSEDVVMRDEDDESEGTGGKRMRLRGKRPPDINLRRTIEEKRQEAASSDDENIKEPTDIVKAESKESDNVVLTDSISDDKKTRGRPKGKRKARRTIRLSGKAAPSADPNQPQQGLDSSLGTDPSTEVLSSPAISSDTPQKKRKKRKMVLGLEIGRDIVDTMQPGALLNEPPVRQSRRIAQIKIKEEADRRRIEEETLCELKEKKDRDIGSDKKKRKKQKADSEEEEEAEEEDEEVSNKEIEREATKAKKKRKKKKRKKKQSSTKFDEMNPWRSSSGSSSDDDDDNDEDDDEEEEAESEGSVLFKSDHEFSPESDLEKDDESEPLRRARTAQKAQSDVEDADDEYACQKCGKADHPEWILLCDTCDKGWHCSCLRPALMLIPEGDWFCPPCQHNLLVLKLQENLKRYDQTTKKYENELLRKKRLAFVGISLDNVLIKNDPHKSSRASSQDSDNDSMSSPSSSSSGSSSSEESEPVYQLRERRCANTYKFNEYDDMINAAIQDEVEAVRGAGNQGRGKDIATIVNAEKEEAQAEAMMKTQHEMEEDEDEDRKLEKDSDEDYKAEKDEDVEEDDDDEDKPKVSVKKILSRKKHRKLNSLDISSEDDPDSDEDFKGSSSDDDEDPEDQGSSSDDSSFADNRRRGRRGGVPVRRSTRARMTRYDEDFINDDSEDSDRPKKKKSRSVWDESESEESDNSWRQRKKRSKTMPTPKSRSTNKSKSKKRRKKKQVIESDNQSDNEEEEVEPSIERNEFEETTVTQLVPDLEPAGEIQNSEFQIEDQVEAEIDENIDTTQEKSEDLKSQIPIFPMAGEEKFAKKKKESTPKRKKTPPIRRKIIYGGLQDSYPQQEEETLGRRTRGKKINYQEVLASDSEEELKKALKKTEESEDEFVVNEVEDLHEEAEKDSDSGDIYSPNKEGPKLKGKSPKGKKPRKSHSPATKLNLLNDGETPKPRKKPGPKPGSKNKPRTPIMTPLFNNPRSGGEEGDITEEGSLAGIGAGELAELDEEQLDQMMMEDEEYGKRQLELAAIEIARKKKEEREAKKLEKARLKALEILAAEQQRDPNAPEGTDGEAPKKKKRGRRSKAEILAEQMRRDGAPNLSIESTSPNVTTAILSSPSSVILTANPSVIPQNLSANLNPHLSSFLNPNVGLNLAPNLTPTMVPNLSTITTPEAQKIPESLVPVVPGGPDAHGFSPEGMLAKPKRRGRGKGKKTLALEAARAAEAAAKGTDHISGFGTDSNPELRSDDPHILPTPGSSTSGSAPSTPPASIVGVTQGTPSAQGQQQPSPASNYPPMSASQQQPQSSVITRMLQSQPVSGGPQSFAAAAAAMGHKYFGPPNAGNNIMGVPRPGFDLQPRGRIPSPYRQPGQSAMPPHFAAVRSGTPPMRMRVPGPQMYHTPHHPMDPSPSGGGPISITSSRDRSSPLGPGPGTAMIPPAAGSPLTKGGPTPPPPPPYTRGVPPMGRFSDSSPLVGPRHQISPFTSASATNHSLQQPSPPPNRASGNFSPYHPPPPPNYHYGAYPPPPPMTTADDAAAYQGSPYTTEHFSPPSENPAPIQPPPPPPPQPQTQPHPHPSEPGAGNKQFDEEGTGEFGGLVSYFSSQREDDLDS